MGIKRPKKSERVAAPGESLVQLPDIVRAEDWAERNRTALRFLIRLLTTLIFVLSLTAAAMVAMRSPQASEALPPTGIYAIIFMFQIEDYVPVITGALVLLCIGWMVLPPRSSSVVEELEEEADIRKIGEVVRLLDSIDLEVRQAAMATLTRLLPLIKSTDVEQIGHWERGRLFKELSTRDIAENFYFLMALVNALPLIADGRALPYLHTLTGLNARTNSQERVRAAAWRVLPAVEEMARTEEIGNRLLRPSQCISEDSDLLLRSAGRISDASPDQLLRPAPGDGQ
jgi:hypothetical protein